MKKETGEMANKLLEKAKIRFGNPMTTDKPKAYPYLPLKSDDYYWVYECPKCKSRMHAAYRSQYGVRHMCAGCGHKAGSA